jgi:hypothetical protein
VVLHDKGGGNIGPFESKRQAEKALALFLSGVKGVSSSCRRLQATGKVFAPSFLMICIKTPLKLLTFL